MVNANTEMAQATWKKLPCYLDRTLTFNFVLMFLLVE